MFYSIARFLGVSLLLVLATACTNTNTETPLETTIVETTTETPKGPNKPDENGVFTGEYRPIQLKVPTDWTVKEHYKSGVLTVSEAINHDEPHNFLTRVVIIPRKGRVQYNADTGDSTPMPIDLEKSIQKHFDSLKKALKGFKGSEIQEAIINDKPARYFGYTYEEKHHTSTIQLKVLTYAVVHEHETYIINYMSDINKFDNTQALFNEMLTSISFR